MEWLALARADLNCYLHYLVADILELVVRLLRPIEVKRELKVIWSKQVGPQSTFRFNFSGQLVEEASDATWIKTYLDPVRERNQIVKVGPCPKGLYFSSLDEAKLVPISEVEYISSLINQETFLTAYYLWNTRTESWSPLFDWKMEHTDRYFTVSLVKKQLYYTTLSDLWMIDLQTKQRTGLLYRGNVCRGLELDRDGQLIYRSDHYAHRLVDNSVKLMACAPSDSILDTVTHSYYQICQQGLSSYLVNVTDWKFPILLPMSDLRLVDISIDGTILVVKPGSMQTEYYLLR